MTHSHTRLILVKGAPGVGKSSAARHLAQHLPTGALIEVDKLRHMVIDVRWTDQDEHRRVLLIAAKAAASFLHHGFTPVIVVDTFSGDKVDGFLSAFRSEHPEGNVLVAALHATEKVLRDRVLNREEGGFMDLAISTQQNFEALRNARPFEVLIDTSELSPAQVAQRILAAAHVAP